MSGRPGNFEFMTDVRPTLEVLKALEKKDMLPRDAARALQHARSIDDHEARIRVLAALGLSTLDIPLLRDARSRFAGGLPDPHKEMTATAGTPVYEVRDRTGAAWRGALVKLNTDPSAWLILVDAHDRFHRAGPKVLLDKVRNGALGPSALDTRLRDIEQEGSRLAVERAALLESLIDSLITAAGTATPERVSTSGMFADARITVQISEPIAAEWDVTSAHEETSEVAIRLGLSSRSDDMRDELLRTCVPFLQPDSSLWESLYRTELIVQVVLTRAGLMQLLSTDLPLLPVEDRQVPPPTALHYTAKRSLSQAFVSGRAVRAVCGQWWVPIGDDHTHANLPVCPDCDRDAPFAQVVHDILWSQT